jgi:hypothetical protein
VALRARGRGIWEPGCIGDEGGHFAALEQPEILVSEIRTGLRTLRS